MRRNHLKSRRGCKECKRRHIKCDESHPCCTNCRIADRLCSFKDLVRDTTDNFIQHVNASPVSASSSVGKAIQPRPLDTSSASSTPLLLASTASNISTASATSPYYLPSPPTQSSQSSQSSPNQTFTLVHLALLHHVKSRLAEDFSMVRTGEQGHAFFDMTIQHAINTPFLMDQLLAISAAHMSMLCPHQRGFYREEAMQLQTRALCLFNSEGKSQISDNKDFAGFLFSILLSQQALFEALSVQTELSVFLDHLVTSLRMCAGVRTIAGQCLEKIQAEFQTQLGLILPTDDDCCCNTQSNSSQPTAAAIGNANLRQRIETADLGDTAKEACVSAVDLLLRLQTRHTYSCMLRSNADINKILQWPVRVSSHYVNLVEQRRPEALVILSHYAAIIHEAPHYWVLGDASGRYIIESIGKQLGPFWLEWLEWPFETLRGKV